MFTPFVFCGIIFIMSKTIWIDTETLSFDFNRADIIQLAGFIEIDGKVVEKFNWFIRPEQYDDENNIEGIWEFHKKNLGLTKDEILNFEPAIDVYNKFINLLNKYCDKYDRTDKFKVGGFNVQFDVSKLNGWFKFFGDNYLFSYISTIKLDPMYIVPFIINDYPCNKMKLEYMWDYLVECGMPVPEFKEQNHDARSDILKTYWIWKNVCKAAQENFLND